MTRPTNTQRMPCKSPPFLRACGTHSGSPIPNRASPDNLVFNGQHLVFDPFFFAVHAYRHFKAADNGCAHLNGLWWARLPSSQRCRPYLLMHARPEPGASDRHAPEIIGRDDPDQVFPSHAPAAAEPAVALQPDRRRLASDGDGGQYRDDHQRRGHVRASIRDFPIVELTRRGLARNPCARCGRRMRPSCSA